MFKNVHGKPEERLIVSVVGSYAHTTAPPKPVFRSKTLVSSCIAPIIFYNIFFFFVFQCVHVRGRDVPSVASPLGRREGHVDRLHSAVLGQDPRRHVV